MKQKFIDYYMDVAERTSKLSSAIRRQVGAIIVKDNRILSYGYNGMPTGWDNNCEYKDYMSGDAGGWLDPEEIYERWPFEEYSTEYESNRRYQLVTKDEVLHAEMNALMKEKESIDAKMAVANLGAAQMDVYDDSMKQDDFSEIGEQIAALEAKMMEFRESFGG
jgi:deoxycytidylate deaminase